MWFATFWGSMSYILALYVAVLMVAWKLRHRRMFWLRLILCFAGICAYKYIFDYVFRLFGAEGMVSLVIRTLDSFVLYVLSAFSVAICFESNFWATLFCSTAGYCMQHMSQRTYVLLLSLIKVSLNQYVNALLLTLVTAIFYVITYFMFIKKSEYSGTMVDNKVQISVSFFAVLITIFLNSFAMSVAQDRSSKLYIMIFSVVTAILIVYIEFGWLAAKNEALKKDIVKQMLHNSQEQYTLEKEIVEVVNMKVHDLKHMFSSAGAAASISESVQIYDSFFNTGNAALDTVLTSKGLLCEKYGIQFTCLVDGSKLTFLAEDEIFSLFGNILDNAIEAVKKIDEPELKVISLISHYDEIGRLVLHEENYCSGKPEFVNGYPQTTKDNVIYHGFGVRSIGYVVKKHKGICKINASDKIFEIDCIFPKEI